MLVLSLENKGKKMDIVMDKKKVLRFCIFKDLNKCDSISDCEFLIIFLLFL